MLMSHAAISWAVAARPRAGPVVGSGESTLVVAQDAVSTAAVRPVAARFRRRLYEDIGDASVGRNFPGLDRVIVVARRLRVFREPGRARRLDVSFLVHRTARDHGPCAGPVPGQAKARQALRKYRSLERGFLPRRAAVDAHVYAPDATRAGPR